MALAPNDAKRPLTVGISLIAGSITKQIAGLFGATS
jgi:hypothetical protein